jgi:DNA-binding response OmpR family regulator
MPATECTGSTALMSSIHTVPTSPARILLAEDEAKVAQPVLQRFTDIGHEVHWVRAVREVRAELPAFSPDLLILDTTLDTDGLEFFQAIRFAPDAPPAGVIVLIEPGDVGTRERAHQLGAAAVISKPIDGDELVEAAEDLLSLV